MKSFILALLVLFGGVFASSGYVLAADTNKALVVVSFGTTFKETREMDIESLEKALASAFPDREFRRAFTSKIVMKRLLENDAIKVDDLDAVLEELYKSGYTDILIQPTHITPGEEIANKVLPVVDAYKSKFAKLAVGNPLLTEEEDFILVANALSSSFMPVNQDEVVVFMGHGSPHQPNPAYQKLEDTFTKLNIPAIVGVVEEDDHPNYEDMLYSLKNTKASKVLLLPLMVVAGDHASNDMAGDEEDSWASLLKKEGYSVRFEVKGIGRNAEIEKIYILHAQNAVNVER